jgi:hypothetical protein
MRALPTVTLADAGRLLCVNATGTGYETKVAPPAPRETLTANRTYHVSTLGNDISNGLTYGASFATFAKLLEVLSGLDCRNYNVTVSLDASTWTTTLTLPNMMGSGTFTVVGTGATTQVRSITLAAQAKWTVTNCKIGDGVPVFGLDLRFGSQLKLSGVTFGGCTFAHISATDQFVGITVTGHYAIAAGAPYHLLLNGGGCEMTCYAKTIALTGTPNFSSGYILAKTANVTHSACTFSGAATGPRHVITTNSVVEVGQNFPGNAAGYVDATSTLS